MAAVPASVLRTVIPGDTLADVLPRLHARTRRRLRTNSSTSPTSNSASGCANTSSRAAIAPRSRRSGGRSARAAHESRDAGALPAQDLPRPEDVLDRGPRRDDPDARGDHRRTGARRRRVRPSSAWRIAAASARSRTSSIGPTRRFCSSSRRADLRGDANEDDDVTGDVKYHHGSEGTYETIDGTPIAVSLANNPSHLEAVDGVVEGRTRALQTNHDTAVATIDQRRAAPILIHGDAAFSAQGVVAEVLNLQSLAGLRHRRHDSPDRQQPGRLHDRPCRRALDALRKRLGQGLRRADRARQRRRRGGVHLRRPPRRRLPPPLRARRDHRRHRLSPLRSQRDRRAGVHAAADVRAHQEPPDRTRTVRAELDRARRRRRRTIRPR